MKKISASICCVFVFVKQHAALHNIYVLEINCLLLGENSSQSVEHDLFNSSPVCIYVHKNISLSSFSCKTAYNPLLSFVLKSPSVK